MRLKPDLFTRPVKETVIFWVIRLNDKIELNSCPGHSSGEDPSENTKLVLEAERTFQTRFQVYEPSFHTTLMGALPSCF